VTAWSDRAFDAPPGREARVEAMGGPGVANAGWLEPTRTLAGGLILLDLPPAPGIIPDDDTAKPGQSEEGHGREPGGS
jgi:hypothetical protein